MARMDVETFDEQLSRFDLMCNGDPTWDLSEKDIDALNAVRTEMRIIAAANRILNERLAELQWREITEQDLPKVGEPVLVVWNGCVQKIAYCRTGIGYACADGYVWETAYDIGGDPIPDEEVTHWHPLPCAPARADEASK